MTTAKEKLKTTQTQQTQRATTPIKRKAPIPVAMREQVWLRTNGKAFEAKCPTPWCQNVISVFDFQSGHNIPESKGGKTCVENLVPLCSRCNLSMGDRYTIDEWNKLGRNGVKEVPLAPTPTQVCCKLF